MVNCETNFKALIDDLKKTKVQHRIIEHGEITNAIDGARILHCKLTQTVKTLGFKVQGRYVFLAIRGDKKLDFKKLASLLDICRSGILRITKDELENNLHYEAGGLSPLHRDSAVKVFFDKSILDVDIVFCGIGLRSRTLEINSTDLRDLSGAIVCDIVQG